MPRLNIPLSQSTVNVEQTIARNFVKQIMHITAFPKEAEIVLSGVRATKATRNNALHRGTGTELKTDYDDYVFARYDIEHRERNNIQKRYTTPLTEPFFFDPDHGISASIVLSEVEMSMALRFRSKSLELLGSWVRKMRMDNAIGNAILTVSADYDIDVPEVMLAYVNEAYQSSVGVDPIYTSLGDYLKSCFGEGLGTRVNKRGNPTDDGNAPEVIYSELQNNLSAFVDDRHFYNAREYVDGAYEVALSVKVRFKLPIGVDLKIPAIVQQKVLSPEWLDIFLPVSRNPTQGGTLHGAHGADRRIVRPPVFQGDGGARLLEWDEYFPRWARDNSQTIFLAPISVDINNPTLVADLNKIPEGVLPDGVLEYLNKYPEVHGEFYGGLVGIELHEILKEEMLLSTTLENGILRSKLDMYGRGRYYVRIYRHVDITPVRSSHITAMLKQPSLMLPLLKLYDPSLVARRAEDIDNLGTFEGVAHGVSSGTTKVDDDGVPYGKDSYYTPAPEARVSLAYTDDEILGYTYTRWSTSTPSVTPQAERGKSQVPNVVQSLTLTALKRET